MMPFRFVDSDLEVFPISAAAAPRAIIDLRLRVWGMGANDQPFHQNAMAQNASANGACIYGLDQSLKVGDVIGVQYETRKARCKVIWIMEVGGLKKIQIGVQLVAGQECPWLSQLAPEIRVAAESGSDKRRYQRHRVPFPLEFRDQRVNTPMRVNATDISGNGCYVETAMPLPIETMLRVDFWIGQQRISTSASVRTRDPGVGMGIEFTSLTEETKKRFQIFLDQQESRLNPLEPPIGR